MARVKVHVVIDASIERVWQALTRPEDVTQWDGAVPITTPAGYPAPGQHALWRTRLGPCPLKLHDRVHTVVPGSRLGSTIDLGFIHIEEEYRLRSAPLGRGVELTIDDDISSRVPGLGWLAIRIVRSDVAESMERLRRLCADEESEAR